MDVQLTIDGQPVRVAPGTTILAAARQAGRSIPTLCHREGLEPPVSCFLCVVQIGELETLVPSCAREVEAGMRVTTTSPEIEAARRTCLELLLSDHRGDCEAPCVLACPARLDVPGFLRELAAGDASRALEVIHERMPFPVTLGRICPRFCERSCRRQESEEAIDIARLHQHLGEVAAGAGPLAPRPASGRKVAIVGAGIAGLTAAHYLQLAGHQCSVLEARDQPGGMLCHALPELRLPRELLAAEIAPILGRGVELRTGVRLESQAQLDELLRSHDAVLLALGAPCEEATDRPPGARSALAFLEAAAMGVAQKVGATVVVLGDGNEAVQAARVARQQGASDVTIVAGRRRSSMRAFPEQVGEAESESVVVLEQADPLPVADLVLAAPRRETDRGLLAGLDLTAVGLFVAGEQATGPGPAVRAMASGREVALAIDRFVSGSEAVPPQGREVHVLLGRLTEAEREVLLAGTTRAPRARDPEVEARRCLGCDCSAREDCQLRLQAQVHAARVGAHRGDCRPLERDDSHPVVVYEPGKCILCGLCVQLTARQDGAPGLTFAARGFGGRVVVPLEGSLAEALPEPLARECARACPTGALALRDRRLASREG